MAGVKNKHKGEQKLQLNCKLKKFHYLVIWDNDEVWHLSEINISVFWMCQEEMC